MSEPTKADLQDVIHRLEAENTQLHQHIYAGSVTIEALKTRLIAKEFELVDRTSQAIVAKRAASMIPDTAESLVEADG